MRFYPTPMLCAQVRVGPCPPEVPASRRSDDLEQPPHTLGSAWAGYAPPLYVPREAKPCLLG